VQFKGDKTGFCIFRGSLYKETEEKEKKAILKGTRWLLLKNPENLDEEKNESSRLAKALSLNEPLMKAYYMKEDLRCIWSQGSREEAERAMDTRLRMAEESDVDMLKGFASTLRDHREGILNYYESQITTGPLEGTNTKIRVLQRRAYGFRDQEYLKLRIYALHDTVFKSAI
jgi:transposase